LFDIVRPIWLKKTFLHASGALIRSTHLSIVILPRCSSLCSYYHHPVFYLQILIDLKLVYQHNGCSHGC
jgi:hypothetical protein